MTMNWDLMERTKQRPPPDRVWMLSGRALKQE